MSDAVPSKDLVSRGDRLGFFCICLGWIGLVGFFPTSRTLNLAKTQPYFYGWVSKTTNALKILICSIW